MCFVDHYFHYHYFSTNWLCSKLFVIYLDWGVKPATFGDISVFSVFWRHGSYLSWEASQQNFVFIFILHLTSPNFWDNKIFLAGTKFNITRNIYCYTLFYKLHDSFVYPDSYYSNRFLHLEFKRCYAIYFNRSISLGIAFTFSKSLEDWDFII